MKKTALVIRHVYFQIVCTRGFLVGTFLSPLLLMGILSLMFMTVQYQARETEHIGVVDLSGIVFEELYGNQDETTRQEIRLIDLTALGRDGDIQALRSTLRNKLLSRELSACIIIPQDVLGSESSVEYMSANVCDMLGTVRLESAIGKVVTGKRMQKEGLDAEKIDRLSKWPGFKTIKVTDQGEREDSGGTFLVIYLFASLLLMSIMVYGTVILKSVAEEKSSKIVEVVLSSISSFQLMMGKLIGVGLVALTQYAIWASLACMGAVLGSLGFAACFPSVMLSKILPSEAVDAVAKSAFPVIPPYIFIYFIIFFVLGYFLFGALYAAVGAISGSEQEGQQLASSLLLITFAAIPLIFPVSRNPNSTLSVILSLVPFFTPILMFVRICVLMPPLTQIALSLVLLTVSALGMIWITAKIYHRGLLIYGRTVGIREVLRWFGHRKTGGTGIR